MARRTKITRIYAAWGEELPDSYLQCRDLGHLWRPYTASWESQERAYRRVLVCTRCTTERTQWVSANGHISHGNAYAYPDGYSAPAGTGRMDGGARDALRLQSVLRMVEAAPDERSKGA
jgi:hypothetical protein